MAAKIGEGRNAEAKSISERLLQLGFALGLAVATVYFAVQPDIPSWFTQVRPSSAYRLMHVCFAA